MRRRGIVRGRKTRSRAHRSRLARALDIVLAVAVLGLLALVAGRLETVSEGSVAGSAAAIDGDTLVIEGRRLRLRGIDAPELDQSCVRDGVAYACGVEARAVLAEIVSLARLVCTTWGSDDYGRLLAACMAGDVAVNRAMVERGWAIADGAYQDAQAVAREERRGIWAGEFDLPREWRVRRGDDRSIQPAEGVWGWLRTLFGGRDD